MTNKEGVIFIEQGLIMREVFRKKSLKGLIAIPLHPKPQASDDATGIGIDNEYRPPCRIEDYRVCGLLPYAMDGEELRAELGDGKRE